MTIATHIGQVQIKDNPIPERSEPQPSGLNLLFFNSELTWVGHRQRCRDISDLSLCLCRENIQLNNVASVQCQRTRCEMIWVSTYVDFASSRLNQLSITLGVLDLRMMNDLDIGFARHAHSQKRYSRGNFHKQSVMAQRPLWLL